MLHKNNSSIVTSLFSACFSLIYVSFIIVKKCGFVMGFVILAIYVQMKTTISNVKTFFFLAQYFLFILYIYRSDKAKYSCIFTSYYGLF